MALAEWMIPRLSLAAEAHLKYQVETLKKHGPANIQDTVQLTCSLLQQNAMNSAMLRQAVGHIAELEMILMLQERQTPSLRRWLLRRFRLHP
jgi:hypothetical protein